MKKLATIFVVSLCIFTTSSYHMISKEKNAKNTQPPIKQPYEVSKMNNVISYKMTLPNGCSDIIVPPTLSLNKLDQTFTFSYDFLSSYLPHGIYIIKDNVLIATTDDNLYTYKFKIKNDTTLLFQQEGSPIISYIDSSVGAKIKNGAKFTVN